MPDLVRYALPKEAARPINGNEIRARENSPPLTVSPSPELK